MNDWLRQDIRVFVGASLFGIIRIFCQTGDEYCACARGQVRDCGVCHAA